MSKLLELLLIEHKTEHKFTKPKIFDNGGEIEKGVRWYVYYSYVNPKTGKMVRQPNIYMKANSRFKSKKGRKDFLIKVRDRLDELLSSGWSPYIPEENKREDIRSCYNFALEHKKKLIAPRTYTDYKSRMNRFVDYLERKGFARVKEINRSVCQNYLNEMLKTSSPRNVNNTRIALSAITKVLVNNDLAEKNYFKTIENLKSKPKRNKIYTPEEVERIFNYLEGEQSLFVKFVYFGFLRPLECCRLDRNSFDFKAQTMELQTKTEMVKIKIVPDVLINEIDKNFTGLLFKDSTALTAEDRRDHFTKQFAKVKKALNLHKDQTIYSFRHTAITKVYRELRKKHGVTETLEKLMLITGHSSIKGLKNYLRTIDAELPEDFSGML